MDREAIRSFALRDWRAVEDAKRDHWAAQAQRDGITALLAAADALRDFVRQVHPDWPSTAERREDLDHHVRLKRDLDAARNAFTGR